MFVKNGTLGLLLRIFRCPSFANFLNETDLQKIFQNTFNGYFANVWAKCGNVRFLDYIKFFVKYSFYSILL